MTPHVARPRMLETRKRGPREYGAPMDRDARSQHARGRLQPHRQPRPLKCFTGQPGPQALTAMDILGLLQCNTALLANLSTETCAI